MKFVKMVPFFKRRLIGWSIVTGFVIITLSVFEINRNNPPSLAEEKATSVRPTSLPSGNGEGVFLPDESSVRSETEYKERLMAKGYSGRLLNWIELGRRDFKQCRLEIEASLDSKLVAPNFRNIVSIICADDASLLPKALEAVSNGRERDTIASMILQECAKRDLLSFVEAAKTHFDGKLKNDALSFGVRQYLELGKPNLAFTLASEMPPSVARIDMLKYVATRFSQENPEATLQWAKSIGDQAASKAIELGAVTGFTSNLEMERAFGLADLIQDNQAKTNFISIMAERLTKEDPKTSTEWIKSFPQDWKDVAEQKYIAVLGEKDVAGATKVALSSTNPLVRAHGVDSIARIVSKGNPIKAREWIEGIPEESATRAMGIVVDELLRNDYSAAKNWIAGFTNVVLREKAYNLASESLHSSDPVRAKELASFIVAPKRGR